MKLFTKWASFACQTKAEVGPLPLGFQKVSDGLLDNTPCPLCSPRAPSLDTTTAGPSLSIHLLYWAPFATMLPVGCTGRSRL